MKLQLEISSPLCNFMFKTETTWMYDNISGYIFKAGLAGIPVSESSANELYELTKQIKSAKPNMKFITILLPIFLLLDCDNSYKQMTID